MTDRSNPFRPSQAEIERRYKNVRAAVKAADLEALIVSGSEYTGFEGGVQYMSGFHILHRYAYVLVPIEGDPICVFPREATWVGDHTKTFLENREFPAHCGQWMADHLKAEKVRRVGVFGYNYIMNVRDYRALVDTGLEVVDFDEPFDLARAQKSEEELESVRNSMDINKAAVLAVIEAYQPGKSEAELMAVAEYAFAQRGTARSTMNMVLTGPNGSIHPQMVFADPHRKVQDSDGLLYGLEGAGQGGHWVEFSRVIAPKGIDDQTKRLLEAYQEFDELLSSHLKAGTSAEEVHQKSTRPFTKLGLRFGHVSGHSIGMTMIEAPRIGEGSEFPLPENMVVSMHPHVMTEDRKHCLYMQDTYRVGADRGERMSGVPIRVYDGTETEL